MSQSLVLEPRRARSRPTTGLHVEWGWTRALQIWLVRRKGWQDLSQLDDRMLEDVGISREEVLWKVGKPFWRS